MAAPRQNGLLSSCEPCSKSKLQCDHSLPVCQRRTARRRAPECTYRLCPLTKTGPKRNRVRSNNGKSTANTYYDDALSHTELFDWAKPTETGDGFFSQLGFLGPTSHLTVFNDHGLATGSQPGLLCDENHEAVDSTMVEIGAQIFSLLDHLPFYAEVLEKRFELFEGWLRVLYHSLVGDSTTIETYSAMTLSEYVSQITPIWETDGLILALIGAATYQIAPDEAVLKRDRIPGKDKQELRKTAIAVSGMCLQFCNRVGAISDPLCWAAIQHAVFMMEMHGAWQRQGDVVSLVFTLGLHQRELDERTPFFLSEIRSRTMMAADSMDEELATFLVRPPRIRRQYCDIQFPLDISWEDLVVDHSTRDAAIQQLDPDGWNVQGDPNKGARPRVTLLASILWEVVLEFSLSREVDNLWDRVKSTVAKRTGETSDSLIETSQQILALFLDLVSKQVRTGRVNHLTIFDFSYIGLPAATVLSKNCCRKIFPQSKIIQRLSVFAGHIETFLSSREGDYDTCMKRLSYTRRVLDFALSPRPGATSEQVTDENTDLMTLFEDFDWEQELRPLFT
ncbi:uncharacterized protein BDW70DRAFT_170382 [Aspergillus foveolatus]|uniref:uncharacterized protein n=1 Tax=Aspergillus foveolatus TaxID=210207 RepID=UPI003CCD0356